MPELPAAGQPIPPRLAWSGLLATGVAAIAGGLSSQVHGLAGADLGGGFGLSADEASWITTAGSMAEGLAVIVAAPLAAACGARRTLMIALAAAGALAFVAHAAAGPEAALRLRFAEGFATGLLPVVMMTWAMRAFPPPRRALPLMLFAFASSAPSALAATVAGEMVLHTGGRGAFLWDVLWTPAAMLVVALFMPGEPPQFSRLRTLDWAGVSLVGSAVMLAILLLTQGERRFWLETSWFAPLVAIAVILACAGAIRLLTASAPLWDLHLLARPTFAVGLAEAFSLRFALLMASFAAPQALGRLGALRPEQAGDTLLWLLWGQLLGFPLAWLWNRRGDARWALGLGLGLFGVAALASASIDPSWRGDQFRPVLLAAGVGQGFYLTSVLAFATWGVPAPAGQTAAGLFNLTRVLGTAGATALVGWGLRIRENGHSARLVESITDASAAVSGRLADLTQTYAALTSDAGAAQAVALAGLAGSVQTQAYTLAFSDVFIGIAAVMALFVLLVPALPRLGAQGSPDGAGARS